MIGSPVVSSTDAGFEIKLAAYDARLVRSIKTLPGRSYNSKRKVWSVPASAAHELGDWIRENHANCSGDAQKRLEECISQSLELSDLSGADDLPSSDVGVEGMRCELYPFQKVGVAYARKARRTFIADDMGLGKTYEALGAICAEQAFPALIIVPSFMKLSWEETVKKVCPAGTSVRVLSGSTPGARAIRERVVIINYDIVSGWLNRLQEIKWKAVVADESHYIKNGKAKRTVAVTELSRAAAARGSLVLMMTGTPILNRPSELIAQLKAMDRLDDMGGWYRFARRYCGGYRDRFGWRIDGATNLEELNEKLRSTCMVRRLKSEVLSELPPKRRNKIPVAITNRKEYQDAEADVVRWLGQQAIKEKDFLDSIAGLSKSAQMEAKQERRQSAEYKAMKAEQLVRFNALRKIASSGKLDSAVQWIQNFILSDQQLVVFAHHRAIVRSLADRLSDACIEAESITGETSIEDRNEIVKRFQSGGVEVLIGNIKAMGVGLTLTAASDALFVEFGWNPAEQDQAEDRLHRIGQSGDVLIHNMVASGTIDDDQLQLIESKREVTKAATDGIAPTESASIMEEIATRLVNRS